MMKMSLSRLPLNQNFMVIFPLFHIIALSNFTIVCEEITLTYFFLVYFGMMFGVHAGFHRYVTHHSWDGPNWFCGFVCLLGCISFQNGPIWWATQHEKHHKHCEKEQDLHSPNKGAYQSHVGWLFTPQVNEPNSKRIINYHTKKNPIILYLDKHSNVLIVAAYNTMLYYINGFTGIMCYWIYPVILCWHMTWASNSLCHRKNEKGICSPVDNFFVGILNLGEGFHKNHHKNPIALCHGFRSIYQIDMVYLVLKSLSYIGLVTKIK